MTSPEAQSKPPPSLNRILGPYQEGTRWRVVLIVNGKRTARTATTRDKAQEILDRLRQRPPAPPRRSISTALREYDAHLRLERHLSPASCEHAQRTLHAFLGGILDDTPASLTSAKAYKLARFEHPQTDRIRRKYAASTRYAVLGHALRFFDWAKAQRYVDCNPFGGVRPVGLVGPVPPLLSLDRARTLAAVTLHSAASDPGALGALLVLVMGLRSGQVLPLRVADVDLTHKRIRISGAADTSRFLTIPALLLPCLRAAQAGRDPETLLLGTGRTGKVRPYNFLWRAVQRLCKQSGVTSTCPRSLRKLHGKLAHTATRASTRLTAALSTPSPIVSTAPDPKDAAPSVRVIDLLGLSLSTTAPRLDALLSILSAEQLAQLRTLLASSHAA